MNQEKINQTITNTYKAGAYNVVVNSNFQSDKKLSDVMYTIAVLRLKEKKAYDDKRQNRRN